MSRSTILLPAVALLLALQPSFSCAYPTGYGYYRPAAHYHGYRSHHWRAYYYRPAPVGAHVVVRPHHRAWYVAGTAGPYWLGFPVMVYHAPVVVEETVTVEGAPEEGTATAPDDLDQARANSDRAWKDQDLAAGQQGWEAMPAEGELDPDQAADPNQGTVEPEPLPAAAPLPAGASGYQFSREMELAVLALINKERTAAGLGELQLDAGLTEAARQHSKEMLELGYFDHESPTPEYATLPDRLARAGVDRYGWAGENIAMSNDATAGSFVRMWMESPGHRANILKPEYTSTGIGIFGAGGSYYVTQVFTSLQ